jgi:quinone-modifying oxidoreductase subunit QmoA
VKPFLKYVIDMNLLGTAAKCAEACQYGAGLDMQPQTRTYQVGAIVLAGGWEIYDTAKVETLGKPGERRHRNMQMEPWRL